MAPASESPDSLFDHVTQGSTLPLSVRSDRKYPRSERRLNPEWLETYWQTGLPEWITVNQLKNYLTAKRFYYKKSDKLLKLKDLARRCARGDPSYDARSVKQLRVLVQYRGLLPQAGHKSGKEQLIRCLEAADDFNARDTNKALPKFHRFFELPPELRNRVYSFYLESLGKVQPRFVVSPLCRASRQLRLETTELFYEYCTFIVLLRTIHVLHNQRMPNQAQLHYHTEVARSNIPSSAFARIKQFSIRLKEHSHKAPVANWDIDLTCGRCGGWSIYDRCFKEKGVQALVDSIIAREGLNKLKKIDLDKLEVVITDAYARWCS